MEAQLQPRELQIRRLGLIREDPVEDHIAQRLRALRNYPFLFSITLNTPPVRAFFSSVDQPPQKRASLLQGAQCNPERALDAFLLLGEKTLDGKGVPYAATKAKHVALGKLPKRAVAVRTGEAAGHTWLVVSVELTEVEF